MRFMLAIWVTAALAMPVAAQQITSEYADLDRGRHCGVFAGGDSDEGDWANLVCQGWRGYWHGSFR